ncbi:hypothetical protein ACJIZ3_019840 [Penstemon smallii]|uniref:Uncharacterized protein n=1 Tax=Penstemon smallii TaxID=265156 RepID=A0ABD3T304_9LAMI
MNRRNGYKYHVHISSEKRRQLNRGQTAKLSNTLGIIAKEHIPMPTRWSKLGEDDLLPAFDFLSLKLDIVRLDREKKDMFHQRFLKHPTKEEALLDVPDELNEENREFLCAYWSDSNVQEICEVNKRNRNKLFILRELHFCYRVIGQFPLLDEKEGRQFNKVEFFPPTHCTNGKWTTLDCEVKYEVLYVNFTNMILVIFIILFSFILNKKKGSSMAPNECYDKIMWVKSGYDKGFGYGPKP